MYFKKDTGTDDKKNPLHQCESRDKDTRKKKKKKKP